MEEEVIEEGREGGTGGEQALKVDMPGRQGGNKIALDAELKCFKQSSLNQSTNRISLFIIKCKPGMFRNCTGTELAVKGLAHISDKMLNIT